MVVRSTEELIYPSSDGKRMAENTVQYRWITTIKGGLDAMYRDRPDVFVAGDLLWYPVEGEPGIRTAPDTMVVFGRPKGDRMSYMQWRENDIGPQVVFEVLSPSNTIGEMSDKLEWYERYGVQEYYVYDPDRNHLQGWIRQGSSLVGVTGIRDGYTSPLLSVHFRLEEELVLLGPDGRRFVDYPELAQERDEAESRAEQERLRAEAASRRAEQERERADQASQRAEQERDRAVKAEAQLASLLEKLRQQGISPDSIP